MTGQLRTDHIVDLLADHVLSRGLERASLRPLAAAAGTSDRMLLYYFPDKAALITAILTRIAQRLQVQLDAFDVGAARRDAAQLQAGILEVARTQMFRPYMHVWLELAAKAARGEEPFRAIGAAIAAGFLTWISDRLEVEPPETRAAQALSVLTMIEGAVVLDALGLGLPAIGDRA